MRGMREADHERKMWRLAHGRLHAPPPEVAISHLEAGLSQSCAPGAARGHRPRHLDETEPGALTNFAICTVASAPAPARTRLLGTVVCMAALRALPSVRTTCC
eukprot:6176288-Pleurochrysis_carterae.AAC.1